MLLLLCLFGWLSADRASAASGDLTQKPGAAGCYSPVFDCMPASPMASTTDVAITPDGKHLYATQGQGVLVFDREADGDLEQRPRPAGCLLSDSVVDPAGCATAGGPVTGTRGMAISDDGRSLYVPSDDSVFTFDIAADGSIARKVGTAGCVSTLAPGCSLGFAMSGGASGGDAAVTPDGRQLFRSDPLLPVLAVLTRAADGSLTQAADPSGCFRTPENGVCAPANGLGAPSGVAISPDGRNVYVAASGSDAVAVFDRDPGGAVTQKPGTAGCVSAGGAGGCAAGRALNGAVKVDVSADGKTVYVTSRLSNAVAVFDRSPNGLLTQRAGAAGCVAVGGGEGCASGRALEGAWDLVIAPDQTSLYVSSFSDDSLVVFDRAPDGSLTQKPGAAGCITGVERDGCATGTLIDGISRLALSPDGATLYASGLALLAFDRELPKSDGPGTDGPGTDGPGTGEPDAVAPVIRALKLKPARFRAARKGPSVARRGRGRARISFRLSESARVKFTVKRASAGRRAGKRCVKPARAKRSKRRCTRWVKQRGSFARAGAAGPNSLRFTGRLGRRTLKPGRFRLIAVARDAAGNHSRPARKKFRVLRRR